MPKRESPLERQFRLGLLACGSPPWEQEYRFCTLRRWRFDFAWPGLMVAVEIEGGLYTRGRHTRGAGYERDLEKYNFAVSQGWRVFRYGPTAVRSGRAADEVCRFVCEQQKLAARPGRE